jgi:hypothetical protein
VRIRWCLARRWSWRCGGGREGAGACGVDPVVVSEAPVVDPVRGQGGGQ